MITKKNITKMFDKFIFNDSISENDIIECGLDSDDLLDIIDEGEIEKIENGKYKMISANNLFFYGRELNAQQELKKASACFKKCYEINPNHSGTCYQLLIENLTNSNFNEFIILLEKLSTSLNQIDYNDVNFFLYLTSMYYKLPKELDDRVKKLTLNDILIKYDNKKYRNIERQNYLRELCFKQKFRLAKKELKSIINSQDKSEIQNVITRNLLTHAINNQTLEKNTISKYIEENDFINLIKYIEDNKSRHKLNNVDEIILFIAKDIVNIQNGNIPKITNNNNCDKWYDFVLQHNYHHAFKIYMEKMTSEKMHIKINTVYIILKKVVNLLDENKINNEISLNEIKNDLINNNLDNAFINIDSYLKILDKQKYQYTIINLIKLSILEKDFSYKDPLKVISSIDKDIIDIDFDNYINKFYKAINDDQLEKAKISLDICENLLKFYKNTEYEKEKNYIKIKRIYDRIMENEEIKKQNINSSEYKDLEYITKKIPKVKKYGIYVLNPMSDEKIDSINKVVCKIHNLVSFPISFNSKKQLVLRYKPKNTEYVNFSEVSKKAKEAYDKRNYDLCISELRKMLEFGEPKAWVYAKIGLAYMKLYKKNTAINYLTVATYKSKYEEKEYDFTNLIDYLKGNINEDDKKKRFKMTINDFKENDNTKEIDKILIGNLIETGMKLEEIIKKLNLNKKQVMILNLELAKEYYALENYNTGDIYLKKVTKEKNKTKEINKLCEEIRQNKKFYKNRREENEKILRISKK